MATFFRFIFLLALFFAALPPGLQAQVKFNLSLLPDQRTYLVSVVSESTWLSPQNMVASAQVAVKLPAGTTFSVGTITSLIDGLSWWDNAYIESPPAAPQYDFICFALNERGTGLIPFEAGVETPLFTFVNHSSDCPGRLELLDNTHPLVQRIVHENQINVTQNITVLGARGNAFAGILNGVADCSSISPAETPAAAIYNLSVFPVPADETLHVYWENIAGSEVDKVLVNNVLGEVLLLRKLPDQPGEQYLKLEVADLPSGVYTGSLINSFGAKETFRFVVIHP